MTLLHQLAPADLAALPLIFGSKELPPERCEPHTLAEVIARDLLTGEGTPEYRAWLHARRHLASH